MVPQCGNCTFYDAELLNGFCASAPAATIAFLSLIHFALKSQCTITDPCRRAKPSAKKGSSIDKTIFDFVVVGGGVSGSVVATRLSENKDRNVLLLESGGEEPTITSIPGFHNIGLDTEVDWQYKTSKQEFACVSTNGVCDWPRGKMIGGSGSLSGMMYSKGSKEMYDLWESMGNKGWKYDDVAPYFNRVEDNFNHFEGLEPDFYDGKISHTFPHQPKMLNDIMNAAKELGYNLTANEDGMSNTGFKVAQAMQKAGVRASTARMYLHPSTSRKNLYIQINSHVTKIIFNKDKKVTGIEYKDTWNETRTISISKELILSGGVVGTTQLLLLSGVGPKNDLKELGITLVQDLPVGRNLHTHVGTGYRFSVKNDDEVPLSVQSLNRYLRERNGPFAGTGITQTTAFMETSFTPKGIPDIQLFMDGFSPACSDYRSHCDSDKENRTLIYFRPTYLTSKSRGYIKLKSKRPEDYPEINPKYLTGGDDIKIIMEGVKLSKKLSETNSLKKWNFQYDPTYMPLCQEYLKGNKFEDKYWECVIKKYTNGENHPGGTAKMGPKSDPDAVVDNELKVYGIPNLRVIDASIVPTPMNCNPIGPLIMIAEKGSDIINKAYGLKK